MLRNPILPGFHADPSIVRVGADYYIATSTFEWYPGVEIHQSSDLARWRLVARPLNRGTQLDLRGNPDSCGVWAPCLTHDGTRFWLVYSDVKRKDGSFKDVRNYIVTAPAVTGPWSEPVFVGATGFDASLFHDPDDGRHWYAVLLWDHRQQTATGCAFAGIGLQEYDAAASRLVGPRRNIFRGTPLALTEGPHLYKRAGRYYLLVAEGGTGYDHAATLCRSTTDSIWGPYEVHPHRHLLTAKDHPLAPLQRTGHADLVDTADGRTFVVHLAGRPTTQRRRCVLGRETAIQPARWADDGWLYIDSGPVPSLHVDVGAESSDDDDYWAAQRYTFDASRTYGTVHGDHAPWLHSDFQWLRSPEPARLFGCADGQLVLLGRESPGSWFEQALVARRQTHFSFDAETVVDVQPQDERQFAGLTLYYGRYNFFYAAVTAHDDRPGQRELQILSSEASAPDGDLATPLAPAVPLPPTGKVRLAATVRGARLQFWYSTAAAATAPDDDLLPVGPVYDASIVSDECGGHREHGSFTGAFVGMAASDLNGTALPARFDYFVYRPAHDATDRYEVRGW